MKTRGNDVVRFAMAAHAAALLLSHTVHSSALVSPQDDPPPTQWQADHEALGFDVLLARPIGVVIKPAPGMIDRCIPEIQILIDEPYATMQDGPDGLLPKDYAIMTVQLDPQPRIDWSILNQQNAVQLLNGFLPAGITLGSPCLIQSGYEGNAGIKHANRFLPRTSDEAHQAFLIEQLDLIERLHRELLRAADEQLATTLKLLSDDVDRKQALLDGHQEAQDPIEHVRMRASITQAQRNHDAVLDRAIAGLSRSMSGLRATIDVIGEDHAEGASIAALLSRATSDLKRAKSISRLLAPIPIPDRKRGLPARREREDNPARHQIFVGRIAGVAFVPSSDDPTDYSMVALFARDESILRVSIGITGQWEQPRPQHDLPTLAAVIGPAPNLAQISHDSWERTISAALPNDVTIGQRCLVHVGGVVNRVGFSDCELRPYSDENDRAMFLAERREVFTRLIEHDQLRFQQILPDDPQATVRHLERLKAELNGLALEQERERSQLEQRMKQYCNSSDMLRHSLRAMTMRRMSMLEQWRVVFDDHEWQGMIDAWLAIAERQYKAATELAWLETRGTGDSEVDWDRTP